MADENEGRVEEVSGDNADAQTDVGSDSVGLAESTLERASQYGLSDSDLKGLNDDAAASVMAAIDRGLMSQRPEPVQNVPAAQQQDTAQVGASFGFEPLKIELGEDLDESVTKPIQSIVESVNGRLKQVTEFQANLVKELQAMETIRQLSEFDGFIAGLGDDFKAEYGSGSTLDMDPNSQAFKDRMEVFYGAQSIFENMARRGQKMTMADARRRAHGGKFFNKIRDIEKRSVMSEIDRRRASSSERPSHSTSAHDRMTAHQRRWLR